MPPEPQIFTQQRKLREGAKQRMALGLTVHLLTDLPPAFPSSLYASLPSYQSKHVSVWILFEKNGYLKGKRNKWEFIEHFQLFGLENQHTSLGRLSSLQTILVERLSLTVLSQSYPVDLVQPLRASKNMLSNKYLWAHNMCWSLHRTCLLYVWRWLSQTPSFTPG